MYLAKTCISGVHWLKHLTIALLVAQCKLVKFGYISATGILSVERGSFSTAGLQEASIDWSIDREKLAEGSSLILDREQVKTVWTSGGYCPPPRSVLFHPSLLTGTFNKRLETSLCPLWVHWSSIVLRYSPLIFQESITLHQVVASFL